MCYVHEKKKNISDLLTVSLVLGDMLKVTSGWSLLCATLKSAVKV